MTTEKKWLIFFIILIFILGIEIGCLIAPYVNELIFNTKVKQICSCGTDSRYLHLQE